MSELDLDNFYFDEESFIKNETSQIDLSGLTGGKHLRSKLLSLTGQIFFPKNSELVKLGRIVELVHNATLTHDDVIDNSHTRRGSPSVPAQINNKKSVLLGDYMLARALHELSEFKNPELTKELTLTLKDLVEGEWIQYENTNPYDISFSLYETLALKKTSSLFRWSFIAPLLASKNSDQHIYDLLVEFGEKLGVIFQMTDDLIDFNPESKKTYGLDFKNNNINFVLQFIGQKYPEYAKSFLHKDDITELNETEVLALNEAINLAKVEIQKYLTRCYDLLAHLKEKCNLSDDHTSLNEFNLILDLITNRVY